MKKSIFAVAAAIFYVGCGGGNPSELVGHWVNEYDDGYKMELFKDGTGVEGWSGFNHESGEKINEYHAVSWKVEKKRLVISSSNCEDSTVDKCEDSINYKVSGYELTFYYGDGDSMILGRKEKLEEFRAKRATEGERQAVENAKQYAERAAQNKPQIERLLEQYFVSVQGGTFTMGCTAEQDEDCEERYVFNFKKAKLVRQTGCIGGDCADHEKPAHSVTVGDFQIGKYEVTQKLWEAVMGDNPSEFKGDYLPVQGISWYDSRTFIAALTLITGRKYRLPAEAEWEFAARGGNKSKGYKYSGSNSLDEVGWYCDNSGTDRKPHSVGTKQPNELGIYDMSGNVNEWCSDLYGDYSANAVTNPAGPAAGSVVNRRVYRGGNYFHIRHCSRVAYREQSEPNFGLGLTGLRLALDK